MFLHETKKEIWFARFVSHKFYKIGHAQLEAFVLIFAISFPRLDASENKSHPDHIQAESNGFPVGSNGRINSPVHKNRLNGVVPRMNMNITPNPLADGDKVFRQYENIPVRRKYY